MVGSKFLDDALSQRVSSEPAESGTHVLTNSQKAKL